MDKIEEIARALAFEAERMSRDAPADAEEGFRAMARAAYEVMANSDGVVLRMRILAALGELRDDMPANDVATVQQFVERLTQSSVQPTNIRSQSR